MATAAIKPSVFTWEGKDRKGNRVKGEAHSTNPSMVKADLRRQGINPTKVRKKSALFSSAKNNKILPKDISVFTRQLATMMSAGVPLVQSFEIIGRGHENPGMQELVLAIKADVESGATLADALRKHPAHFDELVCNLVSAGEQAGILEGLLDKIATYKEKTEAMKAKIKKALTYPAAVVVVAFVVTAILLIFVVPQFEALFSGFGADLPAFTRLVVDLSEWMQANWWMALLGVAGMVYGFKEAKLRSPKVRHTLDRLILKMPVVGEIVTKAIIARYARTLSTMFAAGVPLVDAMESVAGAAGNEVYRIGILQMRDNVATGQQLQMSMNQTGLFPNMVVQMVAIGEESGSLDAMLSKVADFYEAEVDDAVDGLSSLLEPIIMSVLGVLVGGLIVAMYLPIFKMGSAI
ncbi:type II secretion system protein F (GspF) [Thiogranum longum]|uniref:Type II secretion system protein F (GspF) n=1 Tax=Thiogranum longum TaxID=1537524 RepID=A0A4R1H6H4_9GAMM|nr:type II secretion system F family protein [Thiogranum longum]TCK17334.1 type II secretion system protein F (GspF) [Thiogranum longum]